MAVNQRTMPSVPRGADWNALGPVLAGVAELFKHVPDTVFFVKDRAGRYVLFNQSLVERCGLHGENDLLGRHVRDIFPAELGARYTAQDEQVLRTGRPVIDQLELHWYSHRRTGWCLTTKLPLRDASGKIVGLMGLSRDLHALREAAQIPAGLLAALEYLDACYAEPISTPLLARKSGLPPVRFARLIKRIFRLTPTQLIAQRRLAAASQLLRESDLAVAEIALSCGFYDHSAFTRAFHSATGSTPTRFRAGRAGEGIQ
jgi:PAS domain S-box-containing protein